MMKKRVVLVVSALLLLAALDVVCGINSNSSTYPNFLDNTSSNIKIGRLYYSLGENVLIGLTVNASSFKSHIIFENATYTYNNQDSIIFLPKKTGNYSILLEINNTITESLNFTVDFNDTSIFTDKNQYLIGETVLIYLNGINENYTISIKSSSSTYYLAGIASDVLEFIPSMTGTYQIIAENKADKTNLTINFNVVEGEKNEEKILVYTDKKTYYLGEFINVYLDFAKKESYAFYIASENNIYQFLGNLQDRLVFEPKSAGNYFIKIEEADKVLAFYPFEVIETIKEKQLEPFYLINKTYYLGERIDIFLNFDLSYVEILFENESYQFFNATNNITFISNKTGAYTINVLFGNKTFSKQFFIIEKEEKFELYFDLSQDVIIDFDLKPAVENRRTILNIIFGTSPIDRLVFYVENHRTEVNFNLRVEQPS